MSESTLTPSEIEACRLVENMLRSLGQKPTIQICSPRSVEVSDASWAGEASGKTLAEAVQEAMKHES